MNKVRSIVLVVCLVCSCFYIFSTKSGLAKRQILPDTNFYKMIKSDCGVTYERELSTNERVRVFVDEKTSISDGYCPVDWIYIGNINGKTNRINISGLQLCLTILDNNDQTISFSAYTYFVGSKSFSYFKLAEFYRSLLSLISKRESCLVFKITGKISVNRLPFLNSMLLQIIKKDFQLN